MRTATQLLAIFDRATQAKPLIILDWGNTKTRANAITQNEAELLFASLKRRNQQTFKSGIQINPDIEGYTCPVTDQPIMSRAAHRENLKRRGCRLLEPGETRDSRKDRDRQFEQGLDHSVSQAVAQIAHQFE